MSGFWRRPDILDRIPAHGDVVIEASAGTGKTYTLEHLVIDLVLTQGLRLEEILVVTFTEKAAGDLSGRLRSAMHRIHTGPCTDTTGWRIDPTALSRLNRALTSFDAASISTIHAFCKRMLAEHAFVNGRLFKEELVDGRAIFYEAFLDVVRRTLATDPELQPYLTAWLQQDTLQALTARLFEAHTRGGRIHPPYNPGAFADALRALARMELTPAVLKPTLTRAGLRGPSQQAVLSRISALRTVLADNHREPDLASALAALDRDNRRYDKGLFTYVIDALGPAADESPRIAELVNALGRLRTARVPLDAAVVQIALPVVQQALKRDKRASGRFDFDDMLSLVEEALQGPAQGTLLSTLRRRFKVALIDEFQDTDRVQWSIFRRVFADSPQHRLIVIGDPKQAIYGFRGADVQTYLDARAHLTRSQTPVVHLIETYRATEPLASTLNDLLDQRRLNPFFTGEIRYDHPVRAAGTPPTLELDGQACSAVHVFQLIPKKKDTMSPSAAARTLNRRIAEEIADLLEDGCLHTTDDRRPVVASDIFVLTRTTKEGLAVARALRSRGVPYAFYKQDGLFQTQEAKDVRSVLAAIAAPHDRARRLRAWLSPFFAVPLDELRRCLSLPGSHPLIATLFALRSLADEKRWARFFAAILSETGIIQRELLLSDSERELTNYLHILEILLDDALQSKGTLTDLLQTLTAYIDGRQLPEGEDGNVQRLESERAAVQVMTMHKAKGLEAPIVFLTGGLDRNPGFAHIYHVHGERCLYLGDQPPRAAESERDEEDQRLAYVALTRAQSRLYLPYYGGLRQSVLLRRGGTYDVIDRALEVLVADPGAASLSVEALPEKGYERGAMVAEGALSAPASQSFDWPEELPEPPQVAELRRGYRGAFITSYSRLKAALGGFHPAPAAVGSDGEDRVTSAETPPDQLPGGTASGRFIHEMLELIDLDSVRHQVGWRFWAANEQVQALFHRGLRRYDRRPHHLPHSYQLVFNALTTPLSLGGVHLPEGIAGADRVVREMEFLYSVAAGAPAGPSVNRTYVKGFIDVVIEHQGRVIILDWKTDLLPAYDQRTVTAHVEANYGLQADLYTLAVVRLLGIRDERDYHARFGGTAYCFVRGVDASGAGVYFTLPRWSDVTATADQVRFDEGRGES